MNLDPAAVTQREGGALSLQLEVEEARWLITAVTIALRLLEGLRFDEPEAQRSQIRGLSALHRVAERFPMGLTGYYF